MTELLQYMLSLPEISAPAYEIGRWLGHWAVAMLCIVGLVTTFRDFAKKAKNRSANEEKARSS